VVAAVVVVVVSHPSATMVSFDEEIFFLDHNSIPMRIVMVFVSLWGRCTNGDERVQGTFTSSSMMMLFQFSKVYGWRQYQCSWSVILSFEDDSIPEEDLFCNCLIMAVVFVASLLVLLVTYCYYCLPPLFSPSL
jgi:hypothetical protein